MTQRFFFISRASGPLPRSRIGYSIAHTDAEAAKVIDIWRRRDSKHFNLLETNAGNHDKILKVWEASG